ncbi:MAG: aldehyde dehydrogenase family protein, partial [Bdellovibrionales bacterium]|nr:aldehyde dehydrogenase family protein [Bdellovibrionales bacterium]
MSLLKTFNPTTGSLLAELEKTTSEQIDLIVKKSHQALPNWRRLSVRERGDCILKGYENILAHRAEMEKLIHEEMGKTLTEAEREVSYYCGNLQNLIEEV